MALVVAFLLASSSKPSSKASSLETVVTLVDSPSVPESEVAPIPDPQIAAQARIDEAVARAEVDEQAAAELTARREALAGGSAIEQSTSEAAADAAREQSEAALAQVALQAAAEEAERQPELDVLVTPTPVPQPLLLRSQPQSRSRLLLRSRLQIPQVDRLLRNGPLFVRVSRAGTTALIPATAITVPTSFRP